METKMHNVVKYFTSTFQYLTCKSPATLMSIPFTSKKYYKRIKTNRKTTEYLTVKFNLTESC